MIYMKRYRMGQTPRFTNPVGTHRRLQALAAIGHSGYAIGQAAGHALEWSRNVLKSTRITTTTAAKVAAVYDDLCMTVPQGPIADRIRREARAKGYLPPLAWDDIDDPAEQPRRRDVRPRKTDVDPIVIERVLGGDFSLPTTHAEKLEVVRRWLASGRSGKALGDVSGLKVERYIRRQLEAS
jgi:hypothetical protein